MLLLQLHGVPTCLCDGGNLHGVLRTVKLELGTLILEGHHLRLYHLQAAFSLGLGLSTARQGAFLRLRRQLRVPHGPGALLGLYLGFAPLQVLLLPGAVHGALSLLAVGLLLRLPQLLVFRRESLAVIVRRPLQGGLGGSHALELALLSRAELPKPLGVDALELVARLRELPAVLGSLLQPGLAHLVVPHAPHLLLHLVPHAFLALPLEGRHALLGVPERRDAFGFDGALVHLVNLGEPEGEGGGTVVVVRLGGDLTTRPDGPGVRERLQDAQEKRRLPPLLVRFGHVLHHRRSGPEAEHARELVPGHHLLIRQAALGLEHGQGVAVVLVLEVLHVQAVRRALPQRLLTGPRAAAQEHAWVASLEHADEARTKGSFQPVDGTRILKLLEHLTPELAIRQRGGVERHPSSRRSIEHHGDYFPSLG